MIDLNISGNVGATPIRGSPTVTLRQHIIRALYDGTLLSKITKIALVDSAGNERDYTTILSYSVSDNKLTITCNILATSSYTIAKVRSYAEAYIYFETSPASPVPVSEGTQVNVTLEITVSISGSLSYGNATYPLTMVNLGSLVCNVLAGNAPPSKLNISSITLVGTTGSYNVDVAKTLSQDGLSLTFTRTVDIITDNTITAIEVNGSPDVLWRYAGLSIDVKGGDKVTYTETTSA
jgi:hypothetical protein